MSDVARELVPALGRSKPPRGVSARDFGNPRRMGSVRLKAIALALKNLLPALEKKLAECGLRATVGLDGLGESDADTLFAQAAEPLCVLRFRCQKAPAWLVWEPGAASGAVESILGTPGASGAQRRLSPTEARVTTQVLSELTRAVTGALGLAVSDFTLVQVVPELGSWREAGPEAESHRLEVRLALERGGDKSILRLYLGGVDAGAESQRAVLPAKLPAHLERVEVELSVCLPGCELSLDQLLALEEGDVIPLEARLGDPTTLRVEGLELAQARLGSHRGQLAVRVERIDVESDPSA